MTRSRSTSPLRRWALLLLLALGSGAAAHAQPAASDSVAGAPAASASNWPWMLGLLVGGIAIGVLGARWLARQPRKVADVADPRPAPEAPVPRKRAENVPRASARPADPAATQGTPRAENISKPGSFQSLSQLQGREPRPSASGKSSAKSSGTSGKSGHQPRKNSSSRGSQDWTVPHRATDMNPTSPSSPDSPPLEPGQTVEWAAPTSTPPAIQELIDSTVAGNEVPIDRDARVEALTALEAAATPVAANGPVHYYAPAPDVPSIEHRKLSPNPLPQMPLLITLPHAEATTAQFSFSPQADQSRIIGNGVRELKEFFAFELPPTEQFTTIKNLAPGKLEKRDDAWHVVQKAGIALS
ncbi:hypothetical protein [Hymenobacter ruricola]|uniref:Uncharacterized protein n=1 Tax=Hymenobacter ruricola TaxID=2791023 RepID=A0ABS0HYM9_9BACT|nr:hypothetical protein [Hymenobacter ruricola]MBF9219757.1 hypothetical protein [Hymenobacter ruricola]